MITYKTAVWFFFHVYMFNEHIISTLCFCQNRTKDSALTIFSEIRFGYRTCKCSNIFPQHFIISPVDRIMLTKSSIKIKNVESASTVRNTKNITEEKLQKHFNIQNEWHRCMGLILKRQPLFKVLCFVDLIK